MKQAIAVLQDDIDNGEPGKVRRCAIALAANRELFRDDIVVSGRYLMAGTEFYAVLPDSATAFMPRFDAGMPVEPFKFEVEIIQGPGPGSGFSVSGVWVDEILHGFSQILTGLNGEVLGLLPVTSHQYEQLEKYKAVTGYPQQSAPWTADFGQVPLTYAPVTWIPDDLIITTS